MIPFIIPRKSNPVFPSVGFAATFNVPTLGKYNFGTALNAGVVVMSMKRNSLYLIDTFTVGGTVDEFIYTNALNEIPTIKFFRSKSNFPAYERAVLLPGYLKGAQFPLWVMSDQIDENLTVTCTGILNQTADLVGIPSIGINVSFIIYEITETDFIRRFARGDL